MAEGKPLTPVLSGYMAAKLLGLCKQSIYMGWKRGRIPRVNGGVPKIWVINRIIEKNLHKGDMTRLYQYMLFLGFGGHRGKSLSIRPK